MSGFPPVVGPIGLVCERGAGPTAWRWEQGAKAGLWCWWERASGGYQAGLLLGFEVPGLVDFYRGARARGRVGRAEGLVLGLLRGRGLRWEAKDPGILNSLGMEVCGFKRPKALVLALLMAAAGRPLITSCLSFLLHNGVGCGGREERECHNRD